MQRHEVQEYFPQLSTLIEQFPDTHPLCVALAGVSLQDAKMRKTLIPTLERIAENIASVDRDQGFRLRLAVARTHQELMNILSQLYVSYLYRDHGPRMIHGNTHFHIELSIADQLLALGVVQLHSLDSLALQFRDEIDDVETFMQTLATHVHEMHKHDTAHHHVLAAVSTHPSLSKEIALRRYVQEHRDEMTNVFPHVSGVVLIHALPDKEEATFVPFHVPNSQVEWMLSKQS
ncbi:MAG: hypothetical protein KIH62_004060 [Candidatus Kerfeldbacteria bacterium]|nr:hypothetical protein [Candidatus Kerfeldbacteria bacterium]